MTTRNPATVPALSPDPRREVPQVTPGASPVGEPQRDPGVSQAPVPGVTPGAPNPDIAPGGGKANGPQPQDAVDPRTGRPIGNPTGTDPHGPNAKR